MPVKPKPFKIKCQRCRWSKVLAPRSDVLMDGDIPEKCPSCGGKVEFESVSVFTSITAVLSAMGLR